MAWRRTFVVPTPKLPVTNLILLKFSKSITLSMEYNNNKKCDYNTETHLRARWTIPITTPPLTSMAPTVSHPLALPLACQILKTRNLFYVQFKKYPTPKNKHTYIFLQN